MKSQFKNWKCRCSSLGHILTNRPVVDKDLLNKIDILQNEKDTGINANGNKVKWSTAKSEKLASLIYKRDAEDELPKGAKTHLDNVFRSQYWGRRRLLFNKYLDKGNLAEEDSLDLKSQLDGQFYIKNDEYFENKFICGTPDNVQTIIRDAKSNYDMESFDNAELTNLYNWQVCGYIWLLLPRLKTYKGELFYTLVNNPWSQLEDSKRNLWFKMGQPDDDEERWVEACRQLERNHIFDIKRWRENYPGYSFENPVLDFDMPAKLRIKSFDVTLNTRDISFIKSRVVMAREYLIKKEQEVLEKLK